MTKVLTIFIDGVPYDQLHKMPFAHSFESRARLVPILGYSVNCQTQLFTGKTPDEIGFWCEWEYSPETSPFRKIRALLPFLALAEWWHPAERAVHKVLDKFSPVVSTKNIPIRYLSDFDETGHSVFDEKFAGSSLLDDPGMTTFLHWQFADTPRRDAEMVRAAKSHIECEEDLGDILLTLFRIDYSSHWDGVGSPNYDATLLETDGFIRELTEAYLDKVPDGIVYVVSDHGMANIEHHVRIDLESRFGKPKHSTYAYFTEGTILRVWCQDPELRGRIESYLGSFEGVEKFSDDERLGQGITRRSYGDSIFHAHEGYQFVPSFWGPAPSVGMHGHHPRFRSQHGVCLGTREGEFTGEIGATDFYRVLARHLDRR